LGVIDAAIVPLILEGNTLVPPDDPKTLGWWGSKLRAKHGVTLLVGHTVSTGGGALDDLEEVQPGTRINVSGVRYTVTRNRVLSKTALARRATHLFSQRGSHRLVVVTCEDYDPVTKTYASNVVLVAK
jgi:sortase (surface protein transpeptidase)